MRKVTPQQEQILALHRDMQFHCSTEYEFMRDHRKRISELNNDGTNGKPEGYLHAKGYHLVARKCDGSPKGCKGNHNSMVAMRRAEKIPAPKLIPSPYQREPEECECGNTLFFGYKECAQCQHQNQS